MSGQSVLDRMNAARHTITGSDLAKSVFKATTEELLGPKKKHLDYLLQCTNTEHVNIPELADMIIERSTNANWVVVFKTLVSCHHLMVYGNEKFLRYLATRTSIFNLEEFTDKGGIQGYEMSIFVRKYAKYLNQKAYSYRNMAFDFCRAKRGKDDGVLRTMPTEKLLKALPNLQIHLDALLDFEVNSAILSNGVINSAFLLLFKDCIRLFACYNDGIINLLDKFFDMPKKDCKVALDLYKKFLIRMEKVAEFLKVAEQVGVDKGEIPDLAKFGEYPEEYKKAPSSLLEALENHLASLEGKVKANWQKPQTVHQTVTAFTMLLSGDDKEKEKALEEEKERLVALKVEMMQTPNAEQARLKEIAGTGGSPSHTAPAAQPAQAAPAMSASNPFSTPAPATEVPTQAAPSQDLFAPQAPTQPPPASSNANDLIGLNTNPGINAVLQAQRATSQQGQQQWGSTNASTPVHIRNLVHPVVTACASAPGSYTESLSFMDQAKNPLAMNNPFADFMEGSPHPPEIHPLRNADVTPVLVVSEDDAILSQSATNFIDSESQSSTLESVFGHVPLAPSVVTSSPTLPAQSQDLDSTAGFPNNNSIGANFDYAFGAPAVGMQQQPIIVPQTAFMQQSAMPGTGPPVGSEILQPMNKNPPPASTEPLAGGASDLDSTLSSLATNLDIKGGPSPKKTDHQWSKSNTSNVRTGGQSWQPKQVASTTWPQQPQPQYMPDQPSAPPPQNVESKTADWRGNAFTGFFIDQQPPQPLGMNVGMNVGVRPMGVAPMGMTAGYGQPMGQQPMGYPYQGPPQQQDPFNPF